MPKAGDSYIVTLRENHLAWGTYRYTTTRSPRSGEAYLPIPIEYARKYNVFNSNYTGGRDIVGENIFRCRSADGYLDVLFKAQGAVDKGVVFAKQFSVKDNLKTLGNWYQYVNARPGDRIKVQWISPTEMIIELI